MGLLEILFLYIAFRAKQLTCDFFLQTTWMALDKTKPLRGGGALPLVCHAGVHALFTFGITLIFAPHFWWLAPVDFVVHACIDKTKALLENKAGWKYEDYKYWWMLGVDQEAHNFTHLAYIILIVLDAGTPLY